MKYFPSTLVALLAVTLAQAASAQQIGISFCSGSANSTGGPSVMVAAGSTNVSQNDVTLACSSLPQNVLGYFLVAPEADFVLNPGGSSGNLCIGGGIGRYAGSVLSSGSTGSVQFPVDLTSIPSPNGNVTVMPGEDFYFQFWHRDTSPTGATSNFSPGYVIDFAPAAPTFAADIWPMLAQSNIGAPACIICHGANGSGGLNLGFTAPMAYNALVNVSSTSGNCAGSIYVVPGDPSSSLMYDKLTNTPPSCGASMPFGGTFAGDTSLIRDWILSGAGM
ncbi:hypothetical protein Poly30_08050 [Planctomycetes bacterium Poly30]|uniref:Cytochrome c domain-containing protein n=1 Tax=Saltatorellus ferox TaxID=2528018 RepID=A0A518EMJ4_9BACT|nr:hypothetical protein Poly30_08050 [Planctomycetes bacterium Poly30]